MRDIHPESEQTNTHSVVILHNNQKHYQLVKVNRYLIYLIMMLMTFVVGLGLLLLPSENPLKNLDQGLSKVEPLSPPLSAEIKMLKGQVVGLVGGSIESKLRVLEESIRAGQVNTALGAIQDLKRDVKTLGAYSDQQMLKDSPKAETEILFKEVTHLKNLVYLTIASISLVFAGLAGIWCTKRYRLTYQQKAYLPREREN